MRVTYRKSRRCSSTRQKPRITVNFHPHKLSNPHILHHCRSTQNQAGYCAYQANPNPKIIVPKLRLLDVLGAQSQCVRHHGEDHEECRDPNDGLLASARMAEVWSDDRGVLGDDWGHSS